MGVALAAHEREPTALPGYRKTRTTGVYIRHQARCPAADRETARCRCSPSYRGHRWDSVARKMVWSDTYRERAEVLNWLAAENKGGQAVHERADAGLTFADVATEWLAGVRSGVIGRRKGRKGVGYSETTLQGYERSLRYVLLPEFGPRAASEIDEGEWQSWVDRLSREGLSRSRIANHLAVARAVYGWASRPTRRLVPRNTLIGIELPPNDEKPRTRVADADEAAALLNALAPEDVVPYALAFYAGLRRSEIRRLQWPDVELDGYRLRVVKSKSQAGTGRRPPIAEPLRPILLNEYMRQGRPKDGPVVTVSVISNKFGDRSRKFWGWKRAHDDSWVASGSPSPPLEPITLHECRHTYASFLMAAGYTLKELMEYMGHSSLQAAERYIKLLPRPDETDPADRLNAYLRRRASSESAS
jgi:integrase